MISIQIWQIIFNLSIQPILVISKVQLVINDWFHLCTTTVSPRRVYQVLKIKMESMSSGSSHRSCCCYDYIKLVQPGKWIMSLQFHKWILMRTYSHLPQLRKIFYMSLLLLQYLWVGYMRNHRKTWKISG